LPTIDIDGRGKTAKEAVQDMWARIIPLEEKGYHAVSSVEVVDSKTNKVIENFQITDPEWIALRPDVSKMEAQKNKPQEHKPPTAHEYPFKARVRMQS
jgi:hypothetical protein